MSITGTTYVSLHQSGTLFVQIIRRSGEGLAPGQNTFVLRGEL